MTKHTLTALALILAPAWGVLPGAARAALPVDALKKMQKNAPEKVTLDVRTVIQRAVHNAVRDVHYVQVEVEAIVVEVDRSEAGLKVGDAVKIEYTMMSPKSPAPGDYPPLVRAGHHYTSYLKAAGEKSQFRPAAASASFDRAPPREQRKQEKQGNGG